MINYFKELLNTLKKIEEHLRELRSCVGSEYDKDFGYRNAIRTADKEDYQK